MAGKRDEGGVRIGFDQVDAGLFFAFEAAGDGNADMPPIRGGPLENGQPVAAQQLGRGPGHRTAGGDGLDEQFVGAVGIVFDQQAEVGDQDQPLVGGPVDDSPALFVPSAHVDEKETERPTVFRQAGRQVQCGVIGLAGVHGMQIDDFVMEIGDVGGREIGAGKMGVADVAAGLGDQVGDLFGQKSTDGNLQRRQPPGHDSQTPLAGKGQQGPLAGQFDLPWIGRHGHDGIVQVFMDEPVDRDKMGVDAQVQVAVFRGVEHEMVGRGRLPFAGQGGQRQLFRTGQYPVGDFPGALPVAGIALGVVFRKEVDGQFLTDFVGRDLVGEDQREHLLRFLAFIDHDAGRGLADLEKTGSVRDEDRVGQRGGRRGAPGVCPHTRAQGQAHAVGLGRQVDRRRGEGCLTAALVVGHRPCHRCGRGLHVFSRRPHGQGKTLFEALPVDRVRENQGGHRPAFGGFRGILVELDGFDGRFELRGFEFMGAFLQPGFGCENFRRKSHRKAGAGRPGTFRRERQGAVVGPLPPSRQGRCQADAVQRFADAVDAGHAGRPCGCGPIGVEVGQIVCKLDAQRFGCRRGPIAWRSRR